MPLDNFIKLMILEGHELDRCRFVLCKEKSTGKISLKTKADCMDFDFKECIWTDKPEYETMPIFEPSPK